MNILYINNYFPIFNGADSGASNRSTMFITALSKIGKVDIISFRKDSDVSIANCNIIYSEDVYNNKKESRVNKIFKLFAFYSPNAIYPIDIEKEKIVDSFLRSKCYDFIACRYIREASECGLFKYSKKLILDVDDNPKDVVLMAARNAKTIRNRFYNKLFAYSMDSMVKHVLQKVYCCFHSNPLQSPLKDKSVYLHNISIVDAELSPITEQTPLQIMMVGLFHYGPNLEGLQHFLKYVWSIIYKENPNITLNVVGKICNTDIINHYKDNKGVVFKGFVPDLVSEYEHSRVIIVPIYSGSGTSVKVVEAMRMNRTCISTQQGMRGYEKYLTEGTDYLLARNDIEFAKQVLTMITDIDRCNQIAKSAQIRINKYFSKEKFVEIVANTIKQ